MDTREKIELLDQLAPRFSLVTNIRQQSNGDWQAQSSTTTGSVSVSAWSKDFDDCMEQIIDKLAAVSIAI